MGKSFQFPNVEYILHIHLGRTHHTMSHNEGSQPNTPIIGPIGAFFVSTIHGEIIHCSFDVRYVLTGLIQYYNPRYTTSVLKNKTIKIRNSARESTNTKGTCSERLKLSKFIRFRKFHV